MQGRRNDRSPKRCELLHSLSGTSLSFSTLEKLLLPMDGQPDEVREQIAADLLEQFKGAETPEQIQKRAEEILAAR